LIEVGRFVSGFVDLCSYGNYSMLELYPKKNMQAAFCRQTAKKWLACGVQGQHSEPLG
jgi:hypothetical protein